MKIKPNRLFSHPVLWFASDDYTNSDFIMDLNHTESFGELILDYKFTLINPELTNRIELGEIAYGIHIECSLTMYRNKIITKDQSGSYRIDAKKLNGKVDILPVLIAMEDLDYYRNYNLHEDYSSARVSIRKGSIMGISDYRYLYIDKDKSDMRKKESIFSFVKNTEKEPMKIETDSDKITIKLKDEDFNQLQMLQSSNKYQPVIFSMFIVPALIYALDSVDDDLEAMRDRLWFRSLEKCYNANNVELNRQNIEIKTSYALAQSILEDPITKALNILNSHGGDI